MMEPILIFFLGLVLILILGFRRLVKVPNDKILVIFGKVNNPNEAGVEVVDHGIRFVWPVIQDFELLDLKSLQMTLENRFLSKDQFDVDLNLDIEYAISNDSKRWGAAAVHLIGKERTHIQTICKDIFTGLVKNVIASKDLIDLTTKQQEPLLRQLTKEIDQALDRMGMMLVQVQIKHLQDANK